MSERREDLSDSPLGVVEEPPRWSDVIEGGRRLYAYDGHIPATLFVTDEVTLV